MSIALHTDFGKVGVLLGGRSAERQISLLSGQGVLDALRSRGVNAQPFDTGERSLTELAAEKFDRVFIALHGRWGEDGTLQGALEQFGIPYTGSGVMASAIAMDKVYSKRIWLTHGLQTPRFVLARSPQAIVDAALEFGLPLAIKPVREGSSLGFTKMTDLSQAEAAWQKAVRYDHDVLVEEFIEGREFTVAILGSGTHARALPIVEIVAPAGNYDYQHKYFTDDTRYLCPAPLSEEVTQQIQEVALAAFRTLDCAAWGRVDVLLRADAESDSPGAAVHPYLLEVNTAPGMTSHSLVPMAARALGMSYEDLCLQILQGAALKVQADS